MPNVRLFKPHEIEAIAKLIGDTLTLTDIKSRLCDAGIPTTLSASGTKWQYLKETLEEQQRITGNTQDIVSWIEIVIRPVNFITRPGTHAGLHRDLHTALAYCGYDLRPDGTILRKEPETSPSMEQVQERTMTVPTDQETNADVPPTILGSLSKFRATNPDPSKTGFIMMRFESKNQSSVNDSLFAEIAEAIKSTLNRHGLYALRADDRRYHDDLYPNIQTYMHGCGFGIAVFDRIGSDLHNANVALEVGYMLALRKPVCLLKDDTLMSLQNDLAGKITDMFNTHHIESSIDAVLSKWLRDQGFL